MMKTRKRLLIISGAALSVVLAFVAVFFFVFYLPQKQKEEEWTRVVREYYENKLSLYETENETYADYEVDVAFLGDSLTDGYDLEKYYPQYVTANRGISGETTHGLEKRLQVSVYDLKPKVAVLLIGGNNLSTMFENYESILVGLKENLPSTKIVLVSLTSMGRAGKDKNELAAYNNVVIKKLAAKYNFSFVDLYSPLLDETKGEIHPEYTTDGAHLTPKGYEVFTNTLTPVIEGLMK